jgi:hypothetical protein
MTDRATLWGHFYHILDTPDLDFPRRYYAKVEQTRHWDRRLPVHREQAEAVLARTDRPFSPEKSAQKAVYTFEHRGYYHGHLWALTVAFEPFGLLLFTISLATPAGLLGDPYPRLAEEIMRLDHAWYTYTPRWPRPRYGTLDEALDVVQWGIGLFSEITAIVGRQDGWGEVPIYP